MSDLDDDFDGADPRFVAQLEKSLDDIRAGRVCDAYEAGRRIDLKVAAHKRAVHEREQREREEVARTSAPRESGRAPGL
jgi:hypothetical protein